MNDLDDRTYDRGRRGRLLMLGQATLPTKLALLVVAITFTISPQALDHSAVAFEQRGVIHHIWHYDLLIGSALGVWAALSRRTTLTLELIGLVMIEAALLINLIGFIADTGPLTASGVGLALRIGVCVQFAVRIWILWARPTASMPMNVGHE